MTLKLRSGTTTVRDVCRRERVKYDDIAGLLTAWGIKHRAADNEIVVGAVATRKLVTRIRDYREERNAVQRRRRARLSQPVEGPWGAMLADRVYFIRCEHYVKIGFTNDVADRLLRMRGHCPFEMHLLGSLPGGNAYERELHARFAHLRHRGEWFRLEGDLAEFVAQHVAPSPTTSPTDDYGVDSFGRTFAQFVSEINAVAGTGNAAEG